MYLLLFISLLQLVDFGYHSWYHSEYIASLVLSHHPHHDADFAMQKEVHLAQQHDYYGS
jgi:hypothetical protein